MKKIFILLLMVNLSLYAQKIDYNVKNGCGVNGYDLVAYFNGKAIKGKPEYVFTYNDVKYQFSNIKNLEKFKLNSKQYLPQYGGWCAYAMGKKGKKVDMDPTKFEIRDDKLYLFYTSYFTDTYKKWLKEGPEELKEKATKNWKEIKVKK
ncbi:MAG: hypothetical protein L3J23_00840 [Flavobacteriaceae bacterium]|nr:hypothetical protein [Flavobacteriaceae bacterium]